LDQAAEMVIDKGELIPERIMIDNVTDILRSDRVMRVNG